jgi:hypothetical protein
MCQTLYKKNNLKNQKGLEAYSSIGTAIAQHAKILSLDPVPLRGKLLKMKT